MTLRDAPDLASRGRLSRRAILGALLVGGAGAIAVACAPAAAPQPTAEPAGATPVAAAPTATSAPAAAAATPTTAAAAAAATPTTAPAAAGATPTTAPAAAAAPASGGATTLSFYSGGDTNIHDLWANDLFGLYKKVKPEITMNLVFAEHGNGDQTTLDRVAAAQKAGKPSEVDIWETDLLQQGGQGGLIQKLSAELVPNLAKVPQDVFQQQGGFGVPYRGSSVVLAYNSKDVPQPPKTFDALLAWIKANPGKFTYNPPDTGGSGGAFVTHTLKSGIPDADLKLFQTGYDASKENELDKGFATLKDLHGSIYNNGFYPKGNVGVLQTLGKGAISVAPVWSDQGLSYLAQKLLPPEVKLIQIDPPFSGGASFIGMVADSQHKQQVYDFLNWLLTPEPQGIIINKLNGYPGLDIQYMPADVQSKFGDIAKTFDHFSFSSKFSSDINKQWYEKIAGTPPPSSG